MPEPIFTETLQIGIVVRNLDAAIRRYEDDYGIGPWERYGFTPDQVPDLTEDGKPASYSTKAATAKVGSVWWELIEPVDTESTFARFLAEKGEGVHHIGVVTPDYDKAIAMQTEPLPFHVHFMGVEVAYIPTDKTLGVLLEVFKGEPPLA